MASFRRYAKPGDRSLNDTTPNLSTQLQRVLDSIGIVAWTADPGTLDYSCVSPKASNLLGHPVALWTRPGFRNQQIHPRDRGRVLAGLRNAGDPETVVEYRMLHADGSSRWCEDRFRRVCDATGDRLVGVLLDISERRRSEEETAAIQARNAKLQTLAEIGRVATRVSHDFNNLLTLVMGNVELVLAVAEVGERLTPDDIAALRRVLDASERAGEFTRKLSELDPGRQGRQSSIDITDALNAVGPLLAQTLGGPDRLVLAIESGLGALNLEPGQLEHMALNLVSGCQPFYDPDRQMALKARRKRLDQLPDSAIGEYSPGWFLVLQLDCPWLEPVDMAGLYQPFQVDKVQRDNTLSLTAVLASVVKGGGFLDVRPASGSCRFDLCLPLPAQPDEESPADLLRHGRRLRVMVCEESKMERSYVARTLRSFGHSIVADLSAAELSNSPLPPADGVDLLVIEEGQRELARSMLDKNHQLKVLMISGDGSGEGVDPRLDPSVHYLQRPFGNQELDEYIQDLID